MANAAPAQNKTVKAAAMIRRNEEKFVVTDNIADSCNGWTFSNTPHTAVAAKRILISRSM
jgi:hypothetical protein